MHDTASMHKDPPPPFSCKNRRICERSRRGITTEGQRLGMGRRSADQDTFHKMSEKELSLRLSSRTCCVWGGGIILKFDRLQCCVCVFVFVWIYHGRVLPNAVSSILLRDGWCLMCSGQKKYSKWKQLIFHHTETLEWNTLLNIELVILLYYLWRPRKCSHDARSISTYLSQM